MGAGGYLFLAVLVWWNVWSTHPTSTTTCGCGDTSLFTWFLEWPAYAISHGLNPLYSTAMFHPTGVNLLSNTGVVGIGVVLAPITWIFGPIATLNVALTLAPALSAMGMYVLLRRWVTWTPAAFVGGLLYGFSPFILVSVTDSHLMLGMAPIPPLIVACLDELLVRQRRAPVATGVVLGLLVAVQFFIGTETLVLTIIAAAIGIALVTLYYVFTDRGLLLRRAKHAVIAATATGVTVVALLAYPFWFALAGPAHLAGPVWGSHSLISYGGANLKDYLLPAAPSAVLAADGRRFGGYQAPTLSAQYFGIGLLAVMGLGLAAWRRDARLWLFATVGAILVPISFGLQFHRWTIWRLVYRLPFMDNVIPGRFVIFSYLAAAVLLGLIVDHIHTGFDRRITRSRHSARYASRSGSRWRSAGSIAGLAASAIAVAPIASYYSDGLPFTTSPVVLPMWFRSVAPHLSGDQVILAFPVPFYLLQSSMTWQAVDHMSYSMVGGGGPDSLLERAGKEAVGQTYIGNLSISPNRQAITPEEIAAVRKAFEGWGVTMVVVPDPSGLPIYERVHLVRTTAILMTAVTGRQPIRQAHAWVWTGVSRDGPPVLASTALSTACDAGPENGSVMSIERSAACVLTAPVEDPARYGGR